MLTPINIRCSLYELYATRIKMDRDLTEPSRARINMWRTSASCSTEGEGAQSSQHVACCPSHGLGQNNAVMYQLNGCEQNRALELDMSRSSYQKPAVNRIDQDTQPDVIVRLLRKVLVSM